MGRTARAPRLWGVNAAPAPTSPWLVVGLGNPGPKYADTRHNTGFMVADEIARRAASGFTNTGGMHADVALTRLGATGFGAVGDAVRVVVAKPRTFMNDSGRAVRALAQFHKVDPAHIIVVHDELDIDFGQIRVKFGGGDNGHNGLKSIRAHLGTGDYYRVRYGIGRPPGRMDTADYVLQPFARSVAQDVGAQTGVVTDAVEHLVLHGLEQTQNRFNR